MERNSFVEVKAFYTHFSSHSPFFSQPKQTFWKPLLTPDPIYLHNITLPSDIVSDLANAGAFLGVFSNEKSTDRVCYDKWVRPGIEAEEKDREREADSRRGDVVKESNREEDSNYTKCMNMEKSFYPEGDEDSFNEENERIDTNSQKFRNTKDFLHAKPISILHDRRLSEHEKGRLSCPLVCNKYS